MDMEEAVLEAVVMEAEATVSATQGVVLCLSSVPLPVGYC
jgi:hypothetical protein